MTSARSKLCSDDVSAVVVVLDTNPFFWATSSSSSSSLSFSQFLSHVLAFLNSILMLNQVNRVAVIASSCNSCDYIYDSTSDSDENFLDGNRMQSLASTFLAKLEQFVLRDEKLRKMPCSSSSLGVSSLLSGSLSMALCYIQMIFRSGPHHPQPRILCLQGSPDGPEQYVAVMNAIFSAQRSAVPIDCCYVGAHNSAFLQQASHITGGVYLKPHLLDGLFQYLCTVFATDLHSRAFLQLPRPAGVDFRASCFCHKTTIDMGYICSVCLSIFCEHHHKCSTCGGEEKRRKEIIKYTLIVRIIRRVFTFVLTRCYSLCGTPLINHQGFNYYSISNVSCMLN